MNVRPHKNLAIWNKIMGLIEVIYTSTGKFPKEEAYGLVSQMRRASVSIASNLAEGSARRSKAEKAQFYSMSRGSLSELDAQLEISLRLGFLGKSEYEQTQDKIDEVSRMLQGLINSCKNT